VVTAFVKEWLKGEIIAADKIKMDAPVNDPAPAAKAGSPAPPSVVSQAPADPPPPVTENSKETKPKKSLLNKIKEKAGAVTGNNP
ncbi:MAG: hypothetical protein JNM19_02770, partial [Chitinophagaceae bacterium]|nr:hypothetical protein [Chitinophagaceae bacterium]